MAFICKCDKCNEVYETGFKGKWSKEIHFGKMFVTTDLEIRPPHLCNKCLHHFLHMLVKEVKLTYPRKKENVDA